MAVVIIGTIEGVTTGDTLIAGGLLTTGGVLTAGGVLTEGVLAGGALTTGGGVDVSGPSVSQPPVVVLVTWGEVVDDKVAGEGIDTVPTDEVEISPDTDEAIDEGGSEDTRSPLHQYLKFLQLGIRRSIRFDLLSKFFPPVKFICWSITSPMLPNPLCAGIT